MANGEEAGLFSRGNSPWEALEAFWFGGVVFLPSRAKGWSWDLNHGLFPQPMLLTPFPSAWSRRPGSVRLAGGGA